MNDDVTYPTPPHDLFAERAVIGAMMLNPVTVDEVGQVVAATDFYHTYHQRTFEIIQGLRAAGKPADAIHVNAELQATGELTKFGRSFIFDLVQGVPIVANAAYHAKIIRDRSLLRKVIETATRFAQMANSPGMITGEELVDEFHLEITALERHGMSYDDLTSTLTHAELLASEDTYDWLIPGLIERRDRVMITGEEGLGKSTVNRQVAVCAAAGTHPFTRERIEPVKVLVVDGENGPALSRRRFRSLIDCMDRSGTPVPEGKLWIDLRPEGINLLDQQDVRWLMRRVEHIVPDLIVIGPVYKLHLGNPNDEEPARAVAAILDRARALYGSALMIETHSPHGDGSSYGRPLRPLGSSLWLRWPDYGFGIRLLHDKDKARQAEIRRLRLVERVDWRGARDLRHWPKRMEAGNGGSLPWVTPPDDWSQPSMQADPHDGDRGGW